MASDSLRKKWGTIFMGGREATLDELDAMQEPVLRERQQRDQQEEYLERVRKRAADRAREILGNAYNERQKLLQDAKEELEQKRAKLLQEIEGLKAKALQMHEEAEAELEKAKQLRIEAEKVKEAAHDEGFQVGMDQAGVELKEFRADLGHELGRLMLAMEGQLEQIATFWRDDLAELMRVAVRSGLGYVLSKEYEHILENLVFQAINLLEERSVVSFRVNPEDESLVSDMFRAAREKVPELKQWIVNGDPSIERGGLVAESGSGSVDLRRQNFTELLDSILTHLTLPSREAEREAMATLHDEVLKSAERFSQNTLGQEQEEPKLAQAEPNLKEEAAAEAEQEDNLDSQVESQVESQVQSQVESQVDGQANQEAKPSSAQQLAAAEDVPASFSEQVPEVPTTVEEPVNAQTQAQPELAAPSLSPLESEINEDYLLPDEVFNLEGDDPEAMAKAVLAKAKAEHPEAFAEQAKAPKEEAAKATDLSKLAANAKHRAVDLANLGQDDEAPSLAELEEELFPVHQDQEHEVLANGGFLPEPQKNS